MKQVFDFIKRYLDPSILVIKPQLRDMDAFSALAENFQILESEHLDYPEGSDVHEFVLQFDCSDLYVKYGYSDRGDDKTQHSMLKFSGVLRFVQSGGYVGPVIGEGIGKLSLIEPGDEFVDAFLASSKRNEHRETYTYYVDIEGVGVLIVCCTRKVRKCDERMMELIHYIPDEMMFM